MNISNMKEILKIAHLSGDNIHMVGPHGIGKSEIVSQFAEEEGFHCEILHLTTMDIGDLMGIPTTIEKNGETVTVWAKPVWLQRVHQANENGKHAVIFLDELGRASAEIRQASLQMVLEKRIQEHSLGECDGLKSLIVVADNPADDYDSAEFDKALEDRFMTFDVEVSVDSWLDWARKNDVIPAIIDYIANYPEKLHYTPESMDEKGATPRSWKKLSDILKVIPKEHHNVLGIISSKIGKSLGANFFTFYRDYLDMVSVDDLVKMRNEFGNIDTIEAQKEFGRIIEKEIAGMEIPSQIELAHNLKAEMIKGNKDVDAALITSYLYGMNFENMAGVLKTWKNDCSVSEEDRKFYEEDFAQNMPDKWLFKEYRKYMKGK